MQKYLASSLFVGGLMNVKATKKFYDNNTTMIFNMLIAH